MVKKKHSYKGYIPTYGDQQPQLHSQVIPPALSPQDVLKDPEMMKTAMAAAGSGPEAEMMKKMTENPEMMLGCRC